MANVANKTTVPVDVRMSANTPDFPAVDWIINPPSLEGLISGSVPQYYWKINAAQDDVVEMDAGEKAVVDAAMLPAQKAAKIEAFATETRNFVVARGYDDAAKMYLSGLLSDAYGTAKANRAAYITQFLDWVNSANAIYGVAKAACEAAADAAALAAVTMDLTPLVATDPGVTPEGALAIPG